MEKQRSEIFDKELWYRVTIHRWAVVSIGLLACLIISSFIGFQYRHIFIDHLNKDRAAKVIERVRSKIANAELLGIPDRDITHCRTQFKEAQRLYSLKEYSRSLYIGDSCLKGILNLINEHIDQYESVSYAKITFLKGKVEILKPGSKRWLTAKLGDKIPPKTKVQTYPDSKTEIVFRKDQITLKENSLIELQELPGNRKRPSRMGIMVEQHAHFEAKYRAEKEGDIFSVVQDHAKIIARNDVDLEYKGDEKGIDITNYKSENPLDISQGNQTIKLEENEAVGFKHGGQIPKPEQLIFPPDLIRPENVSLINYDPIKPKSLFLRWSKAKDAKSYLLEVAQDTHFRKINQQEVVKSMRFTFKEVALGTFFWRVASLSEMGRRSSFTDFWSFRVVNRDLTTNEPVAKKPPKLIIEEKRTQGYLIIIKGRTDPGVTLLINDDKKKVEPDGSFTAICSWTKIITIDVFDQQGNMTTEKISVEPLR